MTRVFRRLAPAGLEPAGYTRQDLWHDLSAGLVVAIMLVPQAMAYALLAGLPPIHGLYAATIPMVVYALLGTSRHLSVGPPALMALLTFSGVSAVAEPGTDEYVTLALLAAFLAGLVQLALGLLRMGFLVNFISHPVLSGFVHASVVVIIVGQLDHLLGLSLPARQSTPQTVLHLVRAIEHTSLLTAAIGLGSIAVLVAARWLPRVPGPLLVVVGCTALVYLFRLDRQGVSIVGAVPQGLPDLSMPSLDPQAARELSFAVVTIALVGFIESISVAKAIAARGTYKIDSNQELRSLGLANLGAAFASGYPVAGSFSRTALNYRSGARSQLSSITTALLVVATLLLLTPAFRYLPRAALAAIIVVAVSGLIEPRQLRRAFTISKLDGAAFTITFAITLLVGIEEGIVIGAAFALLAFVRRTAYPDITELGYVEHEDAFLGLRSHPQARTFPQALIVRFDAPLYYANVPVLEERLLSLVADKPDIEYLIIDCRGVTNIDVTAVDGLEDLVTGYSSRGVTVIFTHANRAVRWRLHKAGWRTKFGTNIVYRTTREALRGANLLNRGRSTS